MRLEVQNASPFQNPSQARVRSVVMGLRSYGPRSFASLTDKQGNYLQVAGGGQTCLLERRDARSGRHYRAHHDSPGDVFPDGTALVFSAGEVRLAADEWFAASTIADVFLAFLMGGEFPSQIRWRDVSQSLQID